MKRKMRPPAKAGLPVPRNHVAVALMKRSAGAGRHEQTAKAKRTHDKVSLKRRVIQMEECSRLDVSIKFQSKRICHECFSIETNKKNIAALFRVAR